MQHHKQGFVRKDAALFRQAAGIDEADGRRIAIQLQLDARVVDQQVDQARTPDQRLAQRLRVQHQMAQRREAADLHRPGIQAEQFIVQSFSHP